MAQSEPARKRRRLDPHQRIQRSSSNRNSRPSSSEDEIQCMACDMVLEQDHIGIVCVGAHHLCTECSKNYVKNVLEEPAEHLPLACKLCKAEVVAETFERQLDDQQAQTFILLNLQYNSKLLKANNEVVVSCPFCEYFEINTKDKGRLLFLCKKESCMKTSCVWCKKLIKQNNHNNNNNNEEKKYDMIQEDVESHFECARLAPFKEKWDKALSDGSTRSCPQCGVSGMKNNACTHMTCVRCKTEWCYVCGLAEDELDKEEDEAGIISHNYGWKRNPKRCPVSLNNVHTVDARWPVVTDECVKSTGTDECVMFLHRLRTQQLLKDVVQEIGDANYAAICKKYRVDENCGFDMNEVMTGDHTLIIRKPS